MTDFPFCEMSAWVLQAHDGKLRQPSGKCRIRPLQRWRERFTLDGVEGLLCDSRCRSGDGKVHRHYELNRCLNAIEADVPIEKAVHAILDNEATPKHPKVHASLKCHPCFVVILPQYSPPRSMPSKATLPRPTRTCLERGVFRSVVEPQTAINGFLAETENEPKPFIWTVDPDRIFAAVDLRRTYGLVSTWQKAVAISDIL